jgi:NAD/NADP transhydrogenase alpha subunit
MIAAIVALYLIAVAALAGALIDLMMLRAIIAKQRREDDSHKPLGIA